MCNTTPEIEQMINTAWEYVVVNRHGKAFYGWKEDEFKNEIRQAILNCWYVQYKNEFSNIAGIVHGRVDERRKLFYVSNILTTDKNALPAMVKFFDSFYKGYKLAGHRYKKGVVVEYNVTRFTQKILKRS